MSKFLRFLVRSTAKATAANRNLAFYASCATLTSTAVAVAVYRRANVGYAKDPEILVGAYREGLPDYTTVEISSHATVKDRIWCIFKDGVYDVTEFMDHHPGGTSNLLLAGGTSLEPFWKLYKQHHTAEVYEILEQYRIGNLRRGETIRQRKFVDPFSNEPARPSTLKILSPKPCSAEPTSTDLVKEYFTPEEYFFIRQHHPVPKIDASEYKLELVGVGVPTPVQLTLNDLKKFPKHHLVVAIQCAGNRRKQMSQAKATAGLQWDVGSIGNAVWSGVYLSDILKHSGVQSLATSGGAEMENTAAKHIHFEGYDKDTSGVPYMASVPSQIVSSSDVLLAYEMNHRPLSQEHGYPVRAILPGVVGARCVKWLKRIELGVKESQGPYYQSDYKVLTSNAVRPGCSIDWDSSPPIQHVPVQSAICDPDPTATTQDVTLKAGQDTVELKGYAVSGGGRQIIRVELTSDRGVTWHEAALLPKERPDGGGDDVSRKQHKAARSYDSWWSKHYGWTLWKAKLPIPVNQDKVEVCSKATDVEYNTQPESPMSIWNHRGLLNNSWHCITLRRSKQ